MSQNTDIYALTPPPGSCKFIVNADDLGYCPQRNKGIAECMENGIVTSTSLLVNCAYAQEGVDLVKKVFPGSNVCDLPIGEYS